MAAAAAAAPADMQVRVSFFTRRHEFAIPDTPLTVPGRLRRAALSVMVNHLLQLDPLVTFDFLVEGEFLRSSLEAYIDAKGLVKEEILKLEVVEALPPPQPPHEHPHDDWVSAVAAIPQGACLTGCYDRIARVWNTSGELVTALSGHDDAVAAVAWVPQTDSVDLHKCVTGSFDETLRVWAVDLGGRSAECTAVYQGHSDAVAAVAVQPTGSMFASGGADREIRLWACDPAVEDDSQKPGAGAVSSKRRRVNKGPPVEKALGTLAGSLGAVAALAWPDRATLYSGGADQSVRTWDVETGACIHSMTASRVISALAAAPKGGLVASADFDGAVRLYDPRSDDGAVVKATLASHCQPCSSVAWSPVDGNLLVSGSFDDPVGDKFNNLKLWDIRSQRIPLHNLPGHADKVLGVAWPSAELVCAGGADGRLRMHAWGDVDASAVAGAAAK